MKKRIIPYRKATRNFKELKKNTMLFIISTKTKNWPLSPMKIMKNLLINNNGLLKMKAQGTRIRIAKIMKIVLCKKNKIIKSSILRRLKRILMKI